VAIVDGMADLLMGMGDMVETVKYTPSGGSEAEIDAHVFRNGIVALEERGSSRARPQIIIYVSKTDVPVAIPREDVVKIKRNMADPVYGTYCIAEIIDEDVSSYKLALK
jgi:hypothetical protein